MAARSSGEDDNTIAVAFRFLPCVLMECHRSLLFFALVGDLVHISRWACVSKQFRGIASMWCDVRSVESLTPGRYFMGPLARALDAVPLQQRRLEKIYKDLEKTTDSMSQI